MNVSEIHVDDFGAWHNLTLDDLSKGATVFYGPNEAGKTTLLNIVRTVLYGFSEKRSKKYLPPAQGMRAGGSLLVGDVTGQYRVSRTAPANYIGGDGTLAIQSSEGNARGGDLLTTLLSGVDETIFNNVFAVGLTQMQQLSTLSDTEAANQLYGLATGVDRVSLFEVTKTLEAQRDAILPPADSGVRSSQRVELLFEQKSRLEKELKALRRDAGVHAKMRQEYRELSRELREKEKSKKLLKTKVSRPETTNEIRKHWERCRQLNARLSRVGPLPDIPKHVATRVAESFEQVKKLRREWEQLSAERKRVKAKAAKHRGRDTLYRHAAEIQALDRQRSRIVSLEEDAKRAEAAVEEIDFEIKAEMEAIGLQAGTSASRLPAISDDVIEALRGPARETRELREAAEATRQLAQSYRKEADKIKSELEAAAVRFGGENVALAVRKRTQLIQSLEQRLGLDEHREGIIRQIEEVEEEAKYYQQRSVLPWSRVLAVCGVFSVGAMLMLAGLLNSWFDEISSKSLMPLLTIGGSLSAISLYIKNTLENSAAERAEFCRQQVVMMQEDHARTVEEAAELEKQLKGSPQAHHDQRLIDARQELVELEQFVPLSDRHESLLREAEAAEHQATAAVRMLKDARRSWKASLRTVGLPETLTPSQIGEMTSRVSDVTRLRQRLSDAKREFEDRRQELSTVRERIAELLDVAQIIPIPDGLAAQLSRLVHELEKHAKSGKELELLRQRWEQLHEKQNRISSSAQQIISNRQQLLDSHGVAGMVDFRESRMRASKSAKMRRDRDKRIRAIAKLTEGEYSPKRLQAMLDSRSTKLVDELAELDQQHQSIVQAIGSLQQRSASLKRKLDEQLQDRRCEHKELALQCVEEKIGSAFDQWQRSALVSLVLDKVKKTYETKRQPVALAEASTHFERLTEGRYTRIWTPMGQDSLCVDDSKGNSLPVEKLSRGTRELVFLALRLALVSSYARRGANMPIVLDDVFVNFDDQRAQAVATVLANIASNGQQMLIFTCHERIRSIFHELGHDVRDLPVREGTPPRKQRIAPARIVEAPVTPPVIKEEPIVAERVTTKEELPPAMDPPEPVAEPVTVDAAEPEAAIEDIRLKPEPLIRRRTKNDFDQFTPAWRDEWLEPLPDIAPSGDADD